MPEPALAGRAALVTGAGAGIGLAIARRLAADGVALALFDLRGAKEAAAEIAAKGSRAIALAGDVAREADAAAAVTATMAAFGRLDILVNNAGIALLQPFLETSPEAFRRILDVNVTGAFLMSQAAARVMAAQGGGRIVNIVSISGQRAGLGRTAYGTSKAALIQLTRQMALELAEHAIAVNAVAPGPVETEMAKLMHDEATRAGYLRMVPMGRYGTPEEIAEAVAYLASGRAGYITGHVLDVDGGFMASGIR
ncbi:MAG: glucose 1-dehydrogenase [Alphaproteobacteria bacterium]|nr:glucose 1-dehydrogenase [Alphaproteobacteria bacterium]